MKNIILDSVLQRFLFLHFRLLLSGSLTNDLMYHSSGLSVVVNVTKSARELSAALNPVQFLSARLQYVSLNRFCHLDNKLVLN